LQGATEYLVSYGKNGEFGRFAADEPIACRRGDQLVIETNRGLELGKVIRSADLEHARLLGDGPPGRIIRQPNTADLENRDRLKVRGQQLFRDARTHAARLGLPLEIVDAEILLDGRQAVVHVLRWSHVPADELAETLSRTHELHTAFHDLALPATQDEPAEPAEDHGCGSGGCGSGGCGSGGCSSGGCGSCSSGGGTSTHQHAHIPSPRPQSISLL
jgi:hypothetical protein